MYPIHQDPEKSAITKIKSPTSQGLDPGGGGGGGWPNQKINLKTELNSCVQRVRGEQSLVLASEINALMLIAVATKSLIIVICNHLQL